MIASGSMFAGVPDLCSVGPDIFMFTHSNGALRVLFQHLYPGFDAPWQQAIVVIEEQDILAPAVQKTGIAGSRYAAVGLIDIIYGIVLRDFGGRIGGPVVNQDDFNPRVRLRQDTLNGLRQIAGRVLARNDYRNQGATIARSNRILLVRRKLLVGEKSIFGGDLRKRH